MIRLFFNESDKIKVFSERFTEPAERVRRWLMEWVGEPSLEREGHLPHVPESVYIRIADEEVRLVTIFEGLRSFSVLVRRNPGKKRTQDGQGTPNPQDEQGTPNPKDEQGTPNPQDGQETPNPQDEQGTPNPKIEQGKTFYQIEQGIPIRGRRGAHDAHDKLLEIEVREAGDGCVVEGYCVPEVGVMLDGKHVGEVETKYREYLLGLREALIKAMKPELGVPEVAKSRQRKGQRDELIIELWRQGYRAEDIAYELEKRGDGITVKRVQNIIGELRKRYGEKRVPLHRRRKGEGSESKEQA